MRIGTRSLDLNVGDEGILRDLSGSKKGFMVTVHRLALCLWHRRTVYSSNIAYIIQGSK